MNAPKPSLALDTAKLGIGLYILGLICSVAYFSRYRILSLELTRPAGILVGAEIVLLYGVLSIGAMHVLARVAPQQAAVPGFVAFLFLKDLVIYIVLGLAPPPSVGLAFTSSAIEACLFLSGASIASAVAQRRLGALIVRAPASGWKLATVGFALTLLFAYTVYPRVPAQIGGARPSKVFVFPKDCDLLDSRFNLARNNPRINYFKDSYSLFLLLESGSDYYFTQGTLGSGVTEALYVIKVPKSEVQRLDYYTPQWVGMRGETK
jgi:hypothetical protein